MINCNFLLLPERRRLDSNADLLCYSRQVCVTLIIIIILYMVYLSSNKHN